MSSGPGTGVVDGLGVWQVARDYEDALGGGEARLQAQGCGEADDSGAGLVSDVFLFFIDRLKTLWRRWVVPYNDNGLGRHGTRIVAHRFTCS
jgi:hypothetical protein